MKISIFYLFALITIGSGAVVVLSKKIIYSAFSLLFTFFGVAGLYVFLSADFLAATQILIYVGGILILLLFGVMLTHRIYDVKLRTERVQVLPGILVVGLIFVLLSAVVLKTSWPLVEERDVSATTDRIGTLLMTDFLLPFEVSCVLLLVALIGAVLIARREVEER